MPLYCTDYFCPSNSSACIKRPIQSEGLAPFVRMTFPPMRLSQGGTGQTVAGGQTISTIDPSGKPDLTVGNDSNPPNNHAVIKSFIYGASDGNGAEVEIFDEEGGQFDLFVNKMVKVSGDANDFGCTIEWGWALSDCNSLGVATGAFDQNGSPTKRLTISSSKHFFIILSVQMSFSNGGILFKLDLQDMMEPLFETRSKDVFPGMRLKDAIVELFTKRSNPRIQSVLFRKFTPFAGGQVPCNNLFDNNDMGNQTNNINFNCNPINSCEFKFLGALENSPAADLKCEGQTPLAAVREWLKDKMTDNNKGTIIFWNSTSDISELVILEDPLPKCWSDLGQEQCARSIGTYIVNGGELSPVLSFDPQIKFNFAAAARAGAGVDNLSTAQGEVQKPAANCPENQVGPGKPTKPGDGDTIFATMNEDFYAVYGPGNLKLLIQGLSANQRANKNYENIEAELRIQGDPTLDNPYTIKVKTVSIVVINPFHLRGAGGNTVVRGSFDANCPEWLVGPPCNQILSNKNWFIKGVSHEIREGSFTTTLKLYLPAPGQIG